VCDNHIDRVIAHQDAAQLAALCPEHDACNCTGASLSASAWWTGQMPISLPWSFEPVPPGAALKRFGGWYSHPGASKCADGAAKLPTQPPVPAGGVPANSGVCNWRRLPVARIVYGADLLAQGWNRTGGHAVPCANAEMESNLAAFEAAYAALPLAPRACGE
jgi:hypothetical protein